MGEEEAGNCTGPEDNRRSSAFMPPVFQWEDPRDPDDPSVEEEIPARYLLNKATGAVLDTTHPEFYFAPTELTVAVLLKSFRTVLYDGSPRILGVGEIDFKDDIFGVIGVPNAVSRRIWVSIFPVSAIEHSGDHRSLLGYSEACEPDVFYEGHKEEWFVSAYLDDEVLRETVEAVKRETPREICVSLKLKKGVFRRERIENTVASDIGDLHKVSKYLCPNLKSSFHSTKNAYGDLASVSLISETVQLRDDGEEADANETQKRDQSAIALASLKASIDRLGLLVLAAATALCLVWLMR